MHELAVARSIVDLAMSEAAGRRVRAVTIVVGELTCLAEEPVRFCFSLSAEGTEAEGADLTFRKVPAVLRCRECLREFTLQDHGACPGCGKRVSDVVRGRECYVESIEVEGP